MDYLLRDSYFTGTHYGEFDLTRILRVMRPIPSGIAFQRNGLHAVEDYIVSRFQMYMQIYFHPATRAMEVLLHKLLERARKIFSEHRDYFAHSSPLLLPFFQEKVSLKDYLALDDGVLTTYFQSWMLSPDRILADLAQRVINRRVFKSILFEKEDEEHLEILRSLVQEVGFDPAYYTAIHRNFDLPYDIYRPAEERFKTQIEIVQKDGSLRELSSLSPLVKALTGTRYGDHRFYFPKEMLGENDLFSFQGKTFQSYIKNDSFIYGERKL